MIIVRKEFVIQGENRAETVALMKEYNERFSSSATCRTYHHYSGNVHRFAIEDDYESLTHYEAKWAEQTSEPGFQEWLDKFVGIRIAGTFETNYLRVIE